MKLFFLSIWLSVKCDASYLLWCSAHKTTSTDRAEEMGGSKIRRRRKTCTCMLQSNENPIRFDERSLSKPHAIRSIWPKMTLLYVYQMIFRYILVHLFSASHSQNNRKYSTWSTKEVVFMPYSTEEKKRRNETSICSLSVDI